jgi:hypothetical protein
MSVLSISRSHLHKVLLQKAIFVVYWVGAINQVQHFPSDQRTALSQAPSETQINQYEERPIAGLSWPCNRKLASWLLFIRVLANQYFCIVYLRPEMKSVATNCMPEVV